MVHVPAKFPENTAMPFWVTVRKLNVTDRQTERGGEGGFNISCLGPSARWEIKNFDKHIKDISAKCLNYQIHIYTFLSFMIMCTIMIYLDWAYWYKSALENISACQLKMFTKYRGGGGGDTKKHEKIHEFWNSTKDMAQRKPNHYNILK